MRGIEEMLAIAASLAHFNCLDTSSTCA